MPAGWICCCNVVALYRCVMLPIYVADLCVDIYLLVGHNVNEFCRYYNDFTHRFIDNKFLHIFVSQG